MRAAGASSCLHAIRLKRDTRGYERIKNTTALLSVIAVPKTVRANALSFSVRFNKSDVEIAAFVKT